MIDYSTNISSLTIEECNNRENLLEFKNKLIEDISQIKIQYEDFKQLSVEEQIKKKDWKYKSKKAKIIKGNLISEIDNKLRILKIKKISKLQRIIKLIKFWK